MTLHPDAKLIVIGQVSYSVFLITDLFCLLFFAFGDRAETVKLLVETFERLALLIDRNQGSARAKDLWEKTSIIMIDSVEKDLHIEKGIAKELKSNHVPYHSLCKAHIVEALDRSNINVLANLEHALKLREGLESMNMNPNHFFVEKNHLCCVQENAFFHL